MKFISALVALAAAALVSAQDACPTCLASSLQTLPLCQNLNIVMGEFDLTNTALAACLCSARDGSWIDACSGTNNCGGDIASFKSSFADNLEAAGLSC
ncbi:hypothetical protein BGX21_008778 [Mortierella sp. AD011]|nr:hypothetical protein BGX20_001644 [Mortierella sp. AD010]KAF9397528.1 hypothetical protein BGX21_008778 [Mortierella sp. AD011]